MENKTNMTKPTFTEEQFKEFVLDILKAAFPTSYDETYIENLEEETWDEIISAARDHINFILFGTTLMSDMQKN